MLSVPNLDFQYRRIATQEKVMIRILITICLLLGTTLALADHRDFNRGFNRGWAGQHSGFKRGRADIWSVGISIGSSLPTYRDRYNSGYNSTSQFIFNPSLGFINRNSIPYYNNHGNNRPLVINNTWINNSPTTRVIESNVVRTGKSFLRDRFGRCYERETDRLGNEHRIEVPATRCNF